jgi:hypothetical protein
MKTKTINKLFLPQLKLIAKKYGINLNNEYGYLTAVRILEGKGSLLN